MPELLDEHGYEHRTESDLESDLAALAGPAPNLVVNDVLDTSEEEVLIERAAGFAWSISRIWAEGPVLPTGW